MDNVLRIWFAAILLGLSATLTAAQQDGEKIDPKADEIIRGVANYLRDLESFRVEISMDVHFTMEGMSQQMNSQYSVAVQRPNKLSMVLKQGMMGATIVSDGEKLYTYMPMMENKYTVEDAPQKLGEITEGGADMAGAGMMDGMFFVTALFADDPYDKIMEGVNAVQYLGSEELDGVRCHLLGFAQDDVDWKLWVQTGDEPLPRKVVPDMSKMYDEMAGQMPGAKGMKMEMEVRFDGWAVNVDLPEDQFAFVPPEGAEQVETFFEGMDFGQQTHALVGQSAPAFKLALLDGGELDLSAHKGRDIVILDFWATWCAPCVRALPILIDVADTYKDRGVVFYAVNQREMPEKISTFLESKRFSLRVPLDREGRVGELYGVQGIPQTVVIGKDGMVQAVHVGFMPGMKKKLSDELDALLAGKNLAEEARVKEEAAAVPDGLELAWSVEGRYNAVATDTDAGIVYAVTGNGECVEVDAAGQVRRRFRIQDRSSTVRTANLIGDSKRELLTFAAWGHSVKAHDADGNLLWSYDGGGGVDDVWAGDLNGDGLDEVIIGYNGGTGLHVLDNQGKLLWKYTGIGNVWHVCAGDVNGDQVLEVVTTSARGQVHIFDVQGGKIKDIDVSCYANMVRVAEGGAGGNLILVGGSADGEKLIAVRFNGREEWSITLPGGAYHLDSAQAAHSRPWVAVGMRGGLVHVVDITEGQIIATVGGQGARPKVAWLEHESDESPLLVVATGGALRAFSVIGSAAEN